MNFKKEIYLQSAKKYINKVLVLGDNRGAYHHGCDSVILQLAEDIDTIIADGIPIEFHPGLNWEKIKTDALNAKWVIVNGEGTLHSDRKPVYSITKLAEFRKLKGLPTALVNFSWFDNSVENTKRLRYFDFVSVRDKCSEKIISEQGIVTAYCPDLALIYAFLTYTPHRSNDKVLVGDSTNVTVTRILLNYCESNSLKYLPVVYPPSDMRPSRKALKLFLKFKLHSLAAKFSVQLFSLRYLSHAMGVRDIFEYFNYLQSTRGILTGRFHQVCFAIALKKPFLFTRSNTPKIDCILSDVGLEVLNRSIDLTSLNEGSLEIPEFTTKEKENILAFHELIPRCHSKFCASLAIFFDSVEETY